MATDPMTDPEAPTPEAAPEAARPTQRWPVISSIVVAAAVAVMIALGVWQIERAGEKEALLALYAANLAKPPVAFPAIAPVPDAAMFRTSTVNCLEVTGWRTIGGTSPDGTTGFRQLAECRRGAEGPGFVADMGLLEDPQAKPAWTGGPVTGIVTREPVPGGLWARLTGTLAVPRPMIVAATPAPGLLPSSPPDPSGIDNNHIAYAVQWFLFAGIAVVIFVLAVRRKRRG